MQILKTKINAFTLFVFISAISASLARYSSRAVKSPLVRKRSNAGGDFAWGDFDDAGRDTDGRCSGGDVADYDGAGADDRLLADGKTLDDVAAEAEERLAADLHPARQGGARANVDGFFNLAFVVDDGAGVDDHAVGNFGVRPHNRAGGDYDVSAKASAGRYDAGGMNCIDQFKPHVRQLGRVTFAGLVVSDADDGAFEFFGSQLGKRIELAQDRDFMYGLACQLRVSIDEADGVICSTLDQNIQNNTSMTTGAN